MAQGHLYFKAALYPVSNKTSSALSVITPGSGHVSSFLIKQQARETDH